MRTVANVLVSFGLIALVGGCAAVSDDMRRAEQTYETARYENTLIWLRSAPSINRFIK